LTGVERLREPAQRVADRLKELCGTALHCSAGRRAPSGTIRGVAAIYNRHECRAEQRAALLAWGERLGAIVVVRVAPGSSPAPSVNAG